jgi:hypothetical protein
LWWCTPVTYRIARFAWSQLAETSAAVTSRAASSEQHRCVTEDRAGSVAGAPLTRRFEGDSSQVGARCQMAVFGSLDGEGRRSASGSTRDEVRSIRTTQERAGSVAGAPLTRRFDGGSSPVGAGRWKVVFGSLEGERRRSVGDPSRDGVRGTGVAEERAGSVAGAPLTRRLEGDSPEAGPVCRRVVFGSPDGEPGRSLGDSTRAEAALSASLKGEAGPSPEGRSHKG